MPQAIKRNAKNKAAEELKEKEVNLKYGPMPTFPKQRQFVRAVICVSLCVIVYFYGNKPKESIFASKGTIYPQKTSLLECSRSFQIEISSYPSCFPRKCGRGVYDKVVTQHEVAALLRIAKGGLGQGSAAGSAAILDLHSGAVTYGGKFINIYKTSDIWKLIKPEDFNTYKTVRTKIQHIVAAQFLLDSTKLHLTLPTFFSNLTAEPPIIIHDEYWHRHIDKDTYESFHYTALLYLSDYGTDFEGGRFLFIERDNSTTVVEPLRGRVLIFTSGAENPHRVERVTKGYRLALTIAFTCDSRLSISDPTMHPMEM